MPRELSPSEEREFNAYQALGPLEEVRSKLGKLPKVQGESAERRTKIEALEKENADLKARVPEGAVILSGDEAKAYEAVKASGKTLKDVDSDLKRLGELEQKDAARTREDAVRSVAKAEGLDPDKTVKALANLRDADALKFETGKAKTKDGKEEDAGFVTKADGTKVRLAEWVQTEHSYLNLAADGKSGSIGVKEIPAQRGAESGGKGGSVFDRIRAEAKKDREGGAVTPAVETLAKRLGGTSLT